MSSIRRCTAPLLPLLAATVLLCGCGAKAAGGASSSALPLTSAHLTAYSARYQVHGAASGSATLQVSVPAGGAAQVTFATTADKVTQRAVAMLQGAGWTVASVRETISAPGEKVTIQAEPKGAAMREHAVVNGHVETPSIALKGTWQVNAVLLAALSGVALRPGQKASVEDVILPHATSAPMALTVGKAASVTTPFGTERCYPVTISAGGGVQTAWYEAAAPHALVKYVNGHETFLLSALTR